MNQIAQHLLLMALAILYSHNTILSQVYIYNNIPQQVFKQDFDKRFLSVFARFFNLSNTTLVNPRNLIMKITGTNGKASIHHIKMNEMTYINLLKTYDEWNDIIIN